MCNQVPTPNVLVDPDTIPFLLLARNSSLQILGRDKLLCLCNIWESPIPQPFLHGDLGKH